MKKLIASLLALTMVFSLCSCGGGSAETASPTEETAEAPAQEEAAVEAAESPALEETVEETPEPAPENTMLTVGDTAHGGSWEVTVTAVDCMKKIEDGLMFHMWSPAEQTDYQDVYAEDGYAIVKITYHVDYTGKERGTFTLSFSLDYDDGYTFDTGINHVEPKSESGIGFERKYTFSSLNSFDVDDPLIYPGEDAVTYIIVNDMVLTETDKPLVMNIEIPTSADTWEPTNFGTYTLTQGETETFTYDLRSVEFDLTSLSAEDGEAEGEQRHENTGKVIGPNPHNPSLNEKYGDNSWDIKYGDNPVRDLVFFRDDVDVSAYIGDEITFSFIYDGSHCVDAYIVE